MFQNNFVGGHFLQSCSKGILVKVETWRLNSTGGILDIHYQPSQAALLE